MLLEKKGSVTLACFSPPVILATFLIEAALAIYAWWRYRSTSLGRRSVIFLCLLAAFQLAEWVICQGQPEGVAVLWSKVAFIATAFLPILALDFVRILTKRAFSMAAGYSIAAAISLMLAFYPGLFQAPVCTGRYVAFESGMPALDVMYGVYYFATLFAGIGFVWLAWRNKKSDRRLLAWVLAGYASFMVPTMVLYAAGIVNQRSFPSVFCGFAVLLALIIAFRILPLSTRGRRA